MTAKRKVYRAFCNVSQKMEHAGIARGTTVGLSYNVVYIGLSPEMTINGILKNKNKKTDNYNSTQGGLGLLRQPTMFPQTQRLEDMYVIN